MHLECVHAFFQSLIFPHDFFINHYFINNPKTPSQFHTDYIRGTVFTSRERRNIRGTITRKVETFENNSDSLPNIYMTNRSIPNRGRRTTERQKFSSNHLWDAFKAPLYQHPVTDHDSLHIQYARTFVNYTPPGIVKGILESLARDDVQGVVVTILNCAVLC